MANRNQNNTTDYQHPQESNLHNVHHAMEYDNAGRPILRTTGGALTYAINLPAGFGSIHKFGAVPAMSQNTLGTIWDRNDTVYPWATVDADGILTVQVVAYNNEASIQTNNDGDSVNILGLDADFNEIEETVTIASGTATTTKTFRRVYRAWFIDNASFEPTANRILIKSGGPAGTVVAQITEDVGQTLMSIYTIPAGYTGYLMRIDCTAQSSASGTLGIYARFGNVGSFRIQHRAEVVGTGGPYIVEYPVPLAFPEKSDIDARMHTFSNNGRYTATMDFLLVPNV